jgi:GrpB-like predicted nucleotidyltransferase (UPF0157 family)
VRDQITAKLNEITELDDRQILKKVLNEVFLPLYEHSEAMYKTLEERVFSEMAEASDAYDLYATVVLRDEVDPVHYFLRPMLAEDLEETRYDMKQIGHSVSGAGMCPLMKVFFSCDYRELKPIITGERAFCGSIITDKGRIQGNFTLRQDTRYVKSVLMLYEAFLDNNLPWKTLNHPYIFRFAEVMLQNCERVLEPEEVIREVNVDFAEYKTHVHYNMVPLWNVEPLSLKASGFPVPCEDKIHYEHTVDLSGTKNEHGYLVVFGEKDVRYVRRTRDALRIVAPAEQRECWAILRVINPAAGKNETHKYPLVSNARRQDFSDILAQRTQRAIRTEGELRRLISSFAAAKRLTLVRIGFAPRNLQEGTAVSSYEMNGFLLDELRRADYQQRMILYFTATETDYFLICDLISFVVSEVQLHYPDYKCEGVLL